MIRQIDVALDDSSGVLDDKCVKVRFALSWQSGAIVSVGHSVYDCFVNGNRWKFWLLDESAIRITFLESLEEA
jgi:hypothetical protein